MNPFNEIIAAMLPYVPKPLVRKVASKYVAGERTADMVDTVKSLNAQGIRCTVDLLGEFITDIAQAEKTQKQYIQVLDKLAEEKLDATISIKLTALGLLIDAERCYELTRHLVEQAKGLNNFVRIDMEDSKCTDPTIELYLRLRQEFDNVGIVLQAYLHRTNDDAKSLMEKDAGHFRICKGIYIEPESIAIQEHDETNSNYMKVLETMLVGGARVGIATHDKVLILGAEKLLEALSISKEQYEFQMLLGVEEQLRDMLVDKGHPMRVYVPYGRDWYAYCLRRMKENPKVAGQVTMALIKNPGSLLKNS